MLYRILPIGFIFAIFFTNDSSVTITLCSN